MDCSGLTKQDMDLLQRSDLFQGCAPQAAARAAADPQCELWEATPGDALFGPGRERRRFCILLSGELLATQPAADGHGLVMKRIEAGASFGPAALFHGHGDNAVDFAVKARARILALSEPLLERLMREDFQIALNYIRFLSGRIYYLNARIHSISGAHTERALARYLCGEYENAADGDTVSVRPSLAELAQRLNMGRASLYRALDALEGQGLIQKQGRRITILDSAGLKAL